MKFRFFDSASTTRCCEAAVQAFRQFAVDEFGNPSSAHAPGQRASRAIREARQFFAETFRVEPDQVVFTGSGTEADNLALSGVALKWLENPDRPAFRVLASATDHPAVRKTALSLASFGAEARLLPVDRAGQLRREEFLELLTPSCALCSVQQVNNITGAVLPVEELAALAKERVPGLIFHTDAVQAFGKLRHPSAPSAVDLVSLSAHKISGPKGVGALIVLNRSLLKPARLRPLLWGGDQEMGWRSGTPNPGLIAGFHAAARLALSELERNRAHAESLRARLHAELASKGLLERTVLWNSADTATPFIVSLSVPGLGSSGPLARLLEERGFVVSTGSACASTKVEPEPVLVAMGLPPAACTSSLRISFSDLVSADDTAALVEALDESIRRMALLSGKKRI